MEIKMLWFECWDCGVPFGMSVRSRDNYVRDGSVFHCVRGCRLSFGEGEIKRLQRQIDAKNGQLARAESALRIARREAERYKCPHCPKTYATNAGVLRHVRDVHEAPLRLPKDAGPDALNSKVN